MVFPPPTDVLQALAPSELRNFRLRRYQGDDVAVSLSLVGSEDRAIIRALYGLLQDLFMSLGSDQEKGLQRFVATGKIALLLELTEGLGYLVASEPDVASALHDIRGGAMMALAGRLQMIREGLMPDTGWRPVFLLVRDHLKIMRNSLVGLDDPARDRDMMEKRHSVQLIAEKWKNAEVFTSRGKVDFILDGAFDGDISERCIEFGSLDRVLYNLINNAVRHTSEPQVSIHYFSVPGRPGQNLRFVIANAVSAVDRDRLEADDSNLLQSLFKSSASTTGSGLGLGICALIVGNAFGLTSAEQALRSGYLGVTLRDEVFLAWFHWPILA